MADLRRRLAALAAAAVTAVALAAPGTVRAFPAAPAEADTRPCFEQLPDPVISLRCRHRPRPPGPGRYGDIHRVVCDRAQPGAVDRALERLPAGATLVIVGGARPCLGTVHIHRPVTIVGEPGWLEGAHVPTLQPAEGEPCVIVDSAGAVVLRNLLIQTNHGHGKACVKQHSLSLTLEDSWIRYDGDQAAVDVELGRFILRRSVIAARTKAPALVLEHGGLDIETSSVLATTVGVRVHADEDVRIRRLNVERLDDWTGTERVRASVGIGLDTADTGRLVQIEKTSVLGFSRGVFADAGQEVELQGVTVRDSEYGVLSNGARLRIKDSEIEAVDAGIYAGSGHTWASGNKIIGVRRAGLFVEPGAHLQARDNLVYAEKDGCQALAVEGMDPQAQSCRPWFEAPEFYRTGRASGRAIFDDVWPGAISGQADSRF